MSALALAFLLSWTSARVAAAAALTLEVVDESGSLMPCRVLIKGADGKCVTPADATTLQTGRDLWFVSPGVSQVEVPNTACLLRVEHGHEFVRFKKRYEPGALSGEVKVRMQRWVNMADRGYKTGENHLHVDSVQLGPMAAAEGLDFATSLTWWRGPDKERPIPVGDGRIRRLAYAGRNIATSIYDAELEYSWGAAYIQNLPAPMPIKADPGRPNLDYVRHAVEAGAIVHYQGGWSREVLVDAILGCVHTINVCNNNFALHRFQPRKRYSNLLGVAGFPEYPDTDIGMLRLNTDTYYRLLNCGLRLAAGAGSATGVKAAPVGYNRAYVRLEPDATIDDFYAGWKRGENFVTNGPMLMLRTSAGKRPGDTVAFENPGGTLRVTVDVLCNQTLQTIQIIANGRVAHEIDVTNPHHVRASCDVPIRAGTWIVARCTAHDDHLTDTELMAYAGRGAQEPFGVDRSRLRFAHTSPIYVTVDGRGPLVNESLTEAAAMLDAFEGFAAKTASPDYASSIQAAVDQARKRLGKKSDRPMR